MSTDYGEKERAFLESLKEDTGRDLAEWMALISAQNLLHRNDIIDWLRQQGFMFSKASWIERIHHNGGRPIYGGAAASPRARAPRPPAPAPAHVAEIASLAPREDGSGEPRHAPASLPPAPDGDPSPASALEDLLAKAKAYRPLANFLLSEVRRCVPGVRITPEGTHALMTRAHAFGALLVSPRELRLGLDLGSRAFGGEPKLARFGPPTARIPPAITHMIVLTDARQVTPALIALVEEAASRKD